MIAASIYGFVLALVVVSIAVLAWLTWQNRSESKRHTLSRSIAENNYTRLLTRVSKVEQQSPASVEVRVAELADAVSRLARTHQRFQGRFDQFVSRELVSTPAEDERSPASLSQPCENYAQAQQAGPLSQAARCECSYCMARRDDKRRSRDRLVPKTAAAQGELAKINARKP